MYTIYALQGSWEEIEKQTALHLKAILKAE
jgi:hypothetical protein